MINSNLSEEREARLVILIDNLLHRFEYNEKQANWKLQGSITPDEKEALNEAYYAFKAKNESRQS